MFWPLVSVPEGGTRSNFVAKLAGTNAKKATKTKNRYIPIDFLFIDINIVFFLRKRKKNEDIWYNRV